VQSGIGGPYLSLQRRADLAAAAQDQNRKITVVHELLSGADNTKSSSGQRDSQAKVQDEHAKCLSDCRNPSRPPCHSPDIPIDHWINPKYLMQILQGAASDTRILILLLAPRHPWSGPS
jgi:hypothetical protein